MHDKYKFYFSLFTVMVSIILIAIIVLIISVCIFLIYKYFIRPPIILEGNNANKINVNNLTNPMSDKIQIKSILKNPNRQFNLGVKSKSVSFNPKKFFNDGTVRSL